jgi:hypothetical protein
LRGKGSLNLSDIRIVEEDHIKGVTLKKAVTVVSFTWARSPISSGDFLFLTI